MTNKDATSETARFSSLYACALAKKCLTCDAEPGADCNAPRKTARLKRIDEIRQQLGREPAEHDPCQRMHISRLTAGRRHYLRDLRRAPEVEERVPGQNYSTVHVRPSPKPISSPPPGGDLQTRATRLFGRAVGGGVAWPYGLSTPARRTYRGRPAEYEEVLQGRLAAQETITAWAEKGGLRRSPAGCCPHWLQRPSSRRCRNGGCTHFDAPALDCGWMDHTIAWLYGGRPAALTSAPYGVTQEHRARLSWWTQQHPALSTTQGVGWYGFGTTQIVMWRTDIFDPAQGNALADAGASPSSA